MCTYVTVEDIMIFSAINGHKAGGFKKFNKTLPGIACEKIFNRRNGIIVAAIIYILSGLGTSVTSAPVLQEKENQPVAEVNRHPTATDCENLGYPDFYISGIKDVPNVSNTRLNRSSSKAAQKNEVKNVTSELKNASAVKAGSVHPK